MCGLRVRTYSENSENCSDFFFLGLGFSCEVHYWKKLGNCERPELQDYLCLKWGSLSGF
jgi:hypothetical protein